MTAAADRIAQAEALALAGAVLVPVPQGTKGPTVTGWNSDPAQWIRTPSAAREYLTAHPGAGVGLLHSESQTAALDIDHEGAALALAAVGVDLAAVLASNPYRVRGRKGEKPIFRVPDGLSLTRHALGWPDPSGKKGPGGRPAPLTIFELRGGPVQDVMPPSVHPDTGRPYEWTGPVPSSLAELPELPPELLNLWQRWAALLPVMRAACPWAPAELPAPAERDLNRLSGPSSRGGEGEGASVIDTFNAARSLGEVLGEHGYKQRGAGLWLYPGSSSGQAGVRLRPERTPRGAEVVMSWHAADPLGDGLPRDAFGVWALLAEGVDVYTADPAQRRELVRKAARLLGLAEPERGTAAPQTQAQRAAPAADLPPVAWGEVSPLPPLTEPVPPLPVELLPQPLSEWIQAEARAAGLPLEVLAGPVLVGAGGMLSAAVKLKNALNTPAVPANLWGAVCGRPGLKKTYAVNRGAAVLTRAQKAEFDRLDAQRSELETARGKAAAQLEALEARVKRAFRGGPGKPVEMPSDDELTEAREALREAEAALSPRWYVVNDPNAETLGEILRDSPQGVTVVRDELTGWLAGFERSGRETERAFYLEAANGTESFTLKRVSRGVVHIPLMCAGVLGGIQPGPLADVLDAQRGAGDGLLQRFQVFIWPDIFPEFDQNAQREPVSEALREAAAAVLDELGTLTPEGLGSVYPSGAPAPLTYTPEAQGIYDTWERQHAQALKDLSRGEAYRAHISKQPATFARLALIFHALDVAALGREHPHPARVGAEAAALAAVWCEYLAAHARKLWREGRRADVLDAQTVLGYVERGRIVDGQKVTEARRVLAEGKAGMTGPRLDAALKVLADCGAVRVEASTPPGGKAGGRPVKTLRLHPDALAVLDGAEGVST